MADVPSEMRDAGLLDHGRRTGGGVFSGEPAVKLVDGTDQSSSSEARAVEMYQCGFSFAPMNIREEFRSTRAGARPDEAEMSGDGTRLSAS